MQPEIHADNRAFPLNRKNKEQCKNHGKGHAHRSAILKYHDPFGHSELFLFDTLHGEWYHKKRPYGRQQIRVDRKQVKHYRTAALRRQRCRCLQNTQYDCYECKCRNNTSANQGDQASAALQINKISILFQKLITFQKRILLKYWK